MIKQRGTAIIAAIFIALLVALVAAAIVGYTHHLTRAATANKAYQRIQYMLDSPIPLIENKMAANNLFKQGFSFKNKIGGQEILSFVESPQALLNINRFTHLSAKDQSQAIKNLSGFLSLIGVKQNPVQIAGLLISTLNHTLTATGDSLGLYQWPGHPLTLPSSLRGIPGINAKTYRLLRDWVTVLPTSAMTIPDEMHWPVLVAYGLPIDAAKKLANCLQSHPGLAVAAAAGSCKLPASITHAAAIRQIAAEDKLAYFEVYSYFFRGEHEYQKRILLYREKSGGSTKWYTIWQHSDINE
jgi:type II secretory pathway component PulK